MAHRLLVVSVISVVLMGAAEASASTILSPISAVASSTFFGYPISNTIDQSGLGTGFVSGVTDFDAYLAGNPLHSPIAIPNEWFSAQGVTSVSLTYDLGAVYTVDRLAMWNEEFSGIPTFNVLYSLDGVTYLPALIGAVTVDQPSLAFYPAQVFALGSQTARFIRIDGSGCPQAGGEGHNGCGLGEVAFSVNAASTAVPEPASLLLLASGLGAAAVRRMRRNRA